MAISTRGKHIILEQFQPTLNHIDFVDQEVFTNSANKNFLLLFICRRLCHNIPHCLLYILKINVGHTSRLSQSLQTIYDKSNPLILYDLDFKMNQFHDYSVKTIVE